MILVRHGESHFNVHYSKTRIDPGIIDPRLTDRGMDQAKQVAEDLGPYDHLQVIITSPYWRALHTAEIIAESLNLPVHVDPVVGERAFFACDIGSPTPELKARWPRFNFADLVEQWWPDSGETHDGIQARSDRFRDRMAAHPAWETHLVVSHWGFIRALSGHEVSNASVVRFNPVTGDSKVFGDAT